MSDVSRERDIKLIETLKFSNRRNFGTRSALSLPIYVYSVPTLAQSLRWMMPFLIL